jgi:hypothetical protein
MHTPAVMTAGLVGRVSQRANLKQQQPTKLRLVSSETECTWKTITRQLCCHTYGYYVKVSKVHPRTRHEDPEGE